MPHTHPPYPPEFRSEAVRLARSSDKSIPALAAELGVNPRQEIGVHILVTSLADRSLA